MKFYTSIANYYNKIFPISETQISFIKDSTNKIKNKNMALEIGCGTGNLTLELSKLFNKAIGIDLDKEMLNLAKEKYGAKNNNLSFINLNMLKLEEEFSNVKFDTIICFGNTLVHLSNLEEIKKTLQQIKNTLNPGGVFLLQIINYDYILKNNINQLPQIENDMIRFERYYSYNSNQNHINFKTILTVKKENIKIENQIELYPLLKANIIQILNELNFKNYNFYGNFNREQLTSTSIPLIVEVQN